MRHNTSSAACLLRITVIVAVVACPVSLRGEGANLGQPELPISDSEAIAKCFHLQHRLEARRTQIADSLSQQRLRKQSIAKETASMIGNRPISSDHASSLKQDEFETKAEWEERVAKAKEVERRQVEASQRAWDTRKQELLSKEQEQLKRVEREITRLSDQLIEVKQQTKQARDDAPRDSWVIWRSPSLSRYDLDKGVFPNISYSSTPIAEPAERVLLSHGNFDGTNTAVVATSVDVNGAKKYDIFVPDREVAKKFKQDLADGKVVVASACRCTPQSIQSATEIVVRQAITRQGPEKDDPDYGTATFNILGSILVTAAGGQMDQNAAMWIGEDTARALHRKTRDTIVVQERIAFTADLIAVGVAVGPPQFFRRADEGKLEPYVGVEVR